MKYFITIGASTGGPKALQEVISALSEDIPASVFIVQHMPPGFTKSLASRLNSISKINVKEAENGEIIKRGYAYIAPGDYHMEVHDGNFGEYKIALNQKEPVSGHRPSVNVIMESVSKIKGINHIGIIMTGMGADGSEGIGRIKNSGGMTIAQDEESCVVYGMPRAAINAGVIDFILPLKGIAKQILLYMGVL